MKDEFGVFVFGELMSDGDYEGWLSESMKTRKEVLDGSVRRGWVSKETVEGSSGLKGKRKKAEK